MRELFAMADGRQRDEWERTSSIMAIIATAHSGKEHSPTRFNPFKRNDDRIEMGNDVSPLKMFVRSE